MKSYKLIIGAFIVFFLFVAIDGDLKETRVKVGSDDNLFVQLFKEPVEICYLIMKDGTIYRTTQYLEDKVYLNINTLKQTLKKKEQTIGDIAIIVHNHLQPYRISENDKKIYYRLKGEGFKGTFVIFLQGVNMVLIYEEK